MEHTLPQLEDETVNVFREVVYIDYVSYDAWK